MEEEVYSWFRHLEERLSELERQVESLLPAESDDEIEQTQPDVSAEGPSVWCDDYSGLSG